MKLFWILPLFRYVITGNLKKAVVYVKPPRPLLKRGHMPSAVLLNSIDLHPQGKTV